MNFKLLFILLFFFYHASAQNSFQLAPPFIKYSSIFFNKHIRVPLVFEQPGAYITYTLNKMPDGQSRRYKQPLLIDQNLTTLKARAHSKDFSVSDVSEVTFIKNGFPTAVSFPETTSRYKGTGANTLTDNLGGITNYNDPGWLGYDNDSVSLVLNTKKSKKLQKVLFNMLQNQEAWIFLPSKVVVYGFDEKENDFKLLGSITIPAASEISVKCQAIQINFQSRNTKRLKLVIYNTKLPTWHQGAGKTAWMFIDEVKVY